MATKEKIKKEDKKFRKTKKFFSISFICLAFLGLIYAGIYIYAWLNPKLAINSANSYHFYDINNNLIAGTDEWISLDNISPHLINATISIEDRHFFKHQGFDFPRIVKSMMTNIESGERLEGASTISQQYARNLFLDFDKTWERKLHEAWLTIRLEVHYDKDEILEGYLNTINYGGVFGVENAAKFYFNKSASALTLAEASMLAGIPNNPSLFSPFSNLILAENRQRTVLEAMVRNRFITESEMESALKVDLVFATKEDRQILNTLMYYQDAVMEELRQIRNIPNSLLQVGGLKIFTNFDLNAQEAIENAMETYVDEDSEIQVASIVMEPTTGRILGLAGGLDYSKSQFNRALSGYRSVGSTLKPFLYYAALENGFTTSSAFISRPTTFVFSGDQTYSPRNFNNNYLNDAISMNAALAVSDNIFAVKTHLFLGEDTLVQMLRRVGITAPLDNIPSLALGSKSISLLEMVAAYATLANEGYRVRPHFIRRIEDIHGNILYEYNPVKEAVLNRSITFIINEMLANTADPNFRSYAYPTAFGMAHKMTRKYAVKTGTTEFDHLVFGHNKDVVVGIWSGYDDNREILSIDTHNNRMMWAEIIENFLGTRENNWYTMPNNVVGVLVEPVSGKLANSRSERTVLSYFIRGTEPSRNFNLDDAIPTIRPE